jgi:8-oxo-dGTP pyrophosphatase MutT (NUDIX family)
MQTAAAMRNPWKRLRSHPVCENPWFSVRRDDVIRPDGQPGTYSVVRSERLAVGVLPLWEDGTLTLVGQYRYPIDRYSWEIPEGGGERDGDPLETARRELLEETGIRAGSLVSLGSCHLSNCFLDETCELYVATDLVQGQPQPGGDEELETQRVPVEQVMAMAADGRITDSITIVGLFHLARWLKERG